MFRFAAAAAAKGIPHAFSDTVDDDTSVLPLISMNLIYDSFPFFSFSCRTDGTDSPLLAEPEADGRTDKPKVKYGELVILG